MPDLMNHGIAQMIGWILYNKLVSQLTAKDHAVNHLLAAAKHKNIQLKIVTPDQFDLIVSKENTQSILLEGKVSPLPDFILPRLGSSTTYFTLAILRHLERLGVFVCNKANSIEKVKDKLRLHQLLAESHLPTPKTMLVRFPVSADLVQQELGFPLIIKNITGNRGNGIYLCESKAQFVDIMELLFSINPQANIILQEFIAYSRGRDLRVFVIGGKPIGCMLRTSQTSFKANFSRGAQVENFPLSDEIIRLSTETTKLVGLDVTGVDLLFDKDGLKICEANSSPGFKGFQQATNIHVAEAIFDYIISALRSA